MKRSPGWKRRCPSIPSTVAPAARGGAGPTADDPRHLHMTTPCSIDVVILTWNDGPVLQRAVDSVHRSVGVDARVVVVDNGSEPPAEPVLTAVDELIPLERNRGVAAGRNVGAHRGRAPYLCFLDSDAALHPDTLRVLVSRLNADDRVAVASPVFDHQAPEDSGGVAPTFTRKVRRVTGRTSSYGTGSAHDGVIDVDFTIGACQVVRRSAFEQVGGLDERYFYGPEDADFCMRLRLAGWKVVQVERAGCEHPPRRRNRRLLTVRGLRHSAAVARFLWHHRSYRQRVPVP